MSANTEAIQTLLNKTGLICHTFSYNDLPSDIQQSINSGHNTTFENHYLSLLANAGPDFWAHLKAFHQSEHEPLHTRLHHSGQHSIHNSPHDPDQSSQSNQSSQSDQSDQSHLVRSHSVKAQNKDIDFTKGNHDWFDEHSVSIVNELLELSNLQVGSTLLYPHKHPAPLIKLGELAGWSFASPLGLGVNPTNGPWFAYRALVSTTNPLTRTHKNAPNKTNLAQPSQSPCLSCSAPCVQACPAGAVVKESNFNINACAAYRIKESSSCEIQCHARNACPVGINFQYLEDQRAYHMTRALDALVAWAAKS